MKYCITCLQPDTRPNTAFVKNICPGCNYFSQLKQVDWNERRDILFEIVADYRNPYEQYDCIIGVSGGKDSTRQAIWIRDYLKFKPLLVCVQYPPNQLSNIGAENLSNLIEQGFDVIQIAPNPDVWKKLMKIGFFKFGNWSKSTELALFSGVPRLAINLKIPLIFWGENPGHQRGDMKVVGKTGYDANNIRNMNTLQGGDLQYILDAGFNENEILPYFYPSQTDFIKNNIQIIYLGWFLGDWSLKNNGMISALNGLKVRNDHPKNTSDLYQTSALDEDWVAVNQMIKYLKFGFGKTTEYVNEMIRLGDITRKEGVDLVERFDGKCNQKYIDDFCNFMDISEKKFWITLKKFANRKLFKIVNSPDGRPKFVKRFRVGEDLRI